MKFLFGCAIVAAYAAWGSVDALAVPGVVQISGVQGKVMVNYGDGYQPVGNLTLLNEGDMVMVGDDGVAQITYTATNCRVTLPARSVTTITLPDPCDTAALPPEAQASTLGGSALPWVAVGGVVAAGIVGIVVLTSNSGGGNGDGNPVSNP